MMICRPWITLRNGKVLHASDVGKQAFCFEVDSERPRQEKVSKKPSKKKQPTN